MKKKINKESLCTRSITKNFLFIFERAPYLHVQNTKIKKVFGLKKRKKSSLLLLDIETSLDRFSESLFKSQAQLFENGESRFFILLRLCIKVVSTST
jgi:hypothetical protein